MGLHPTIFAKGEFMFLLLQSKKSSKLNNSEGLVSSSDGHD